MQAILVAISAQGAGRAAVIDFPRRAAVVDGEHGAFMPEGGHGLHPTMHGFEDFDPLLVRPIVGEDGRGGQGTLWWEEDLGQLAAGHLQMKFGPNVVVLPEDAAGKGIEEFVVVDQRAALARG